MLFVCNGYDAKVEVIGHISDNEPYAAKEVQVKYDTILPIFSRACSGEYGDYIFDMTKHTLLE